MTEEACGFRPHVGVAGVHALGSPCLGKRCLGFCLDEALRDLRPEVLGSCTNEATGVICVEEVSFVSVCFVGR